MSEETQAVPEGEKPQKPAMKDSRREVYWPGSSKTPRHAIYMASFPKIIYLWPTILTFLICGTLQAAAAVPEGTLGWIALLVFGLNILVIVQDFDQKKFLILILAIVVIALLVWIVNMKGMQFLKNWTRAVVGLAPALSTSAYFIFGVMLSLLFLWGLLHPLFNYWRFEHNEFVHFIQPFGRADSIPRAGTTVTKDIPDMLEYILTLGGGSLVIIREGQERARIPDIPFLGRRMKALDKMLSETRVTSMDS
jgi:hypothetical protein